MIRRRSLSSLASPAGSSASSPDVGSSYQEANSEESYPPVPDETQQSLDEVSLSNQRDHYQEDEESQVSAPDHATVPIGELTRATVEHRKHLAEAAPDKKLLVRRAVTATAQGLRGVGYAGKSEVNAFFNDLLRSGMMKDGEPVEPLEIWVKSKQGGNGDHAVYDHVASSLADAIKAIVPMLDIAVMLNVPERFYRIHSEVRDVLAIIQAPLVYESEDGKYATVGAYNPLVASLAADAYRDAYAAATGWIPYVSAVRLSHRVWRELKEAHFGTVGGSNGS